MSSAIQSNHRVRMYYFHAALFLVAYGVFTWWYFENQPGVAASPVNVSTTAVHGADSRALAYISKRAAPVDQPRLDEVHDQAAVTKNSESLLDPEAERAAVLTARALNATDALEKTKAITQLGGVENSTAAITALSGVVQTDPVVRNRLLAITSLGNLAVQASLRNAAMSALQAARQDTDSQVAARAAHTLEIITSPAETAQAYE